MLSRCLFVVAVADVVVVGDFGYENGLDVFYACTDICSTKKIFPEQIAFEKAFSAIRFGWVEFGAGAAAANFFSVLPFSFFSIEVDSQLFTEKRQTYLCIVISCNLFDYVCWLMEFCRAVTAKDFVAKTTYNVKMGRHPFSIQLHISTAQGAPKTSKMKIFTHL